MSFLAYLTAYAQSASNTTAPSTQGTSKFVNNNGVSVHYVTYGSGDALVLQHGFREIIGGIMVEEQLPDVVARGDGIPGLGGLGGCAWSWRGRRCRWGLRVFTQGLFALTTHDFDIFGCLGRLRLMLVVLHVQTVVQASRGKGERLRRGAFAFFC